MTILSHMKMVHLLGRGDVVAELTVKLPIILYYSIVGLCIYIITRGAYRTQDVIQYCKPVVVVYCTLTYGVLLHNLASEDLSDVSSHS